MTGSNPSSQAPLPDSAAEAPLRRRRLTDPRPRLGTVIVLWRTASLLWSLPVLYLVGAFAALPAAGLLWFETGRFADHAEAVEEAGAQEFSGPDLSFHADTWDGETGMGAFLGEAHHVVDRARLLRRASRRMEAALRIAFFLLWGGAFLVQAAAARFVTRALEDRPGPGPWMFADMRDGLRRGTRVALALGAAVAAGYGLTAGWLGTSSAVFLPLVLLTMGFSAAYVLVPARVLESDTARAAWHRSADLTRRYRVTLFFLWVGLVIGHAALTLGALGFRADAPRAWWGGHTPETMRWLAGGMVVGGALVITLFGLVASVAHHRLLELRRPSKMQQMTDAFE